MFMIFEINCDNTSNIIKMIRTKIIIMITIIILIMKGKIVKKGKERL